MRRLHKMRYKDMPKIMPPTYHTAERKEVDYNPDLIDRLQMEKLKQSQPYYRLLKENELMNPSEVEEVKGSLKRIDDKFDQLIQKVEEATILTHNIHQKVKDIMWGIEEWEKVSRNEE